MKQDDQIFLLVINTRKRLKKVKIKPHKSENKINEKSGRIYHGIED